MDIKSEIKEEVSSPRFCSQDKYEVLDTDITHRVKCEPVTYSFGCGIDADTKLERVILPDFYSQNERELYSEDPLMNVNKCDVENDMGTKVEVKEELCLPERISTETLTTHEIKDGIYQDFPSAESPRLHTGVCSDMLKSAINSVEDLGKYVSFNMGTNILEYDKARKYNLQDESSIENSSYSVPNDENIDTATACLKQDNLIQQCNTQTYDLYKNYTNNSHFVKPNSHRTYQKVYKCDICEKNFNWLSRLKQHNLIHGVKTHKCTICEKVFTQSAHLKQHILIHNGVKPHRCDICNKDFARISHLKQHNLIHESVKPYSCDICEKGFTLLSHLKRHNMVHEYGKQHKCNICGKSFTQLSYLKTHNMIHEGKQPHKCDTCEKRFTHLSHLKLHILVHEGKKPHKCTICEKRFTRLSHLKTHTLIHEGKKPFKCDICEKRFTRLPHLKTHTLIHEGKKPFKCDICEKRFTRLPHLKTHTLIHEGKKPFKCNICEKSFVRAWGLKKHNLIHEDEKTQNSNISEKAFDHLSI